MFPNGKEAIRVLTAEIEAQEKKQSETPKEAKATPDLVPLPTPVEQELARRVEEIRSKPIPISASIRSDMVRLIEILEKNGKNPELLQKAKEDLVFLDTVVSKHVVEWRVCWYGSHHLMSAYHTPHRLLVPNMQHTNPSNKLLHQRPQRGSAGGSSGNYVKESRTVVERICTSWWDGAT